MKVLVDADTKLILGAALLGIEADEVVQSILHVMAAKQPYTLITRTMPSLSVGPSGMVMVSVLSASLS